MSSVAGIGEMEAAVSYRRKPLVARRLVSKETDKESWGRAR